MYDIRQSINFKGKTVIVTGGSMGIGEGCARAFCSSGANVVICSRGEEPGRRLEEQLNDEYGHGSCTYLKCDVRREEEVINVVDVTIEKFKRLDCLINNAGMHPEDETIDDVTVEMFYDLVQLNLTSVFIFCKYALPHLRKTKGSIINMSSLVGTTGQKLACRYVTTKSAITGLTKALAIDEAKYGVRINSVSPACIETPLALRLMNLMPDAEKQYKLLNSWHQLNRQGNILEAGNVCLFLASDMASFLVGLDIPVSGGAELGYGIKFF